jgi:hypothetical protein
VRLTPAHPAGAAAALLARAAGLAGCTSAEDPSGSAAPTAASSSPAELPVAGEPVRLVSATLEDAVVPQDDGSISWTTTWEACFAPAGGDPAGVARWEARLITPEGASSSVEELPGNCVDLDVATGRNPADAGLLNREIALSDAAGLTYRVRAVTEEGTVTPWTDPVRVTSELPPA